MKKYFMISLILFSCATVKPVYNAQMQVRLQSWRNINLQKAWLTAIDSAGHCYYLRYSWYGRHPKFEENMPITIIYDSTKKKENVFMRADIVINK